MIIWRGIPEVFSADLGGYEDRKIASTLGSGNPTGFPLEASTPKGCSSVSQERASETQQRGA